LVSSAALLHAVAAPRRQHIVRLLWSTERTAGDIAAAFPDITFGAVSQHLRVLHDMGVVQQRRHGKQRIYALRRESLGTLAAFFETQWRSDLERLKTLAESELSHV
jgi:DNA-binding transcriptional ArsR family regulator